MEDFELKFCENCFQMTNHIGTVCQKCKPKKKTRRKRCIGCKELFPSGDVSWVIDPYEEDVKGVVIKGYMCDDCYTNKLADI